MNLYEMLLTEGGRYLGLELPMRWRENHETTLWRGRESGESKFSILSFGDATFEQYRI